MLKWHCNLHISKYINEFWKKYLSFIDLNKMTEKRKNGSEEGNITKKSKHTSGHWNLGLLNSLEDPDLIVESDDLVSVIKDKYPKAEFHYLVIPKENISSLKAVKSQHRDLLKHMHKVAIKLSLESQHENKKFLIGYHAEPSMIRLHLHMVSDDMNSPSLKTKKHWNSYTTGFFLNSKDICQELKENGTITIPSKEMCKTFINQSLKCHKCDYIPKHMPDLKKHILSHIRK